MANYIERESVMAILEDHPAGSWRGYGVYSDEVRAIMRGVEELPAADVALVRHGQWQKAKNGSYYCSVCGRSAVEIGPYHGHAYFTPKFCYYCGVKMDKEGLL